jgi:hypothetical protein
MVDVSLGRYRKTLCKVKGVAEGERLLFFLLLRWLDRGGTTLRDDCEAVR